MQQSVNNRFYENFLGIGVLLAFLLPHTYTLFLLVNPILCILYRIKRDDTRHRTSAVLFIIVPILISFLINILQIDTKAKMTCISLLLYFFCFPIVGSTRVPNGYLWVTLIVILITQVAYILDIPIITGLLDGLYPISDSYENLIGYMQSTISLDNIYQFRLGGLYRNPNQCARAICVLLAAYIIFNKDRSLRKSLLFILLAYYAVFLTGSRTGVVIASAIVMSYFFLNANNLGVLRWIVLLLVFSLLLYVFIAGSDSFRGLNVAQAFEESGSPKVKTFLYYLSTERSPMRLMLGYADAARYDPPFIYMNIFDSEYGNLVFCYGFVGLFGVLLFYYKIYRELDRIGRLYLWLILWMVSSSVLMAYRSSFYFILLLSIVYCRHRKCDITSGESNEV